MYSVQLLLFFIVVCTSRLRRLTRRADEQVLVCGVPTRRADQESERPRFIVVCISERPRFIVVCITRATSGRYLVRERPRFLPAVRHFVFCIRERPRFDKREYVNYSYRFAFALKRHDLWCVLRVLMRHPASLVVEHIPDTTVLSHTPRVVDYPVWYLSVLVAVRPPVAALPLHLVVPRHAGELHGRLQTAFVGLHSVAPFFVSYKS